MTNAQIDTLVFNQIRDGANRTAKIRITDVGVRALDNSLKRLKRAGKIEFVSATGWAVATAVVPY